MDPSHLFWQGIDPVLAVADLGELVYIAAAKDTRINEAAKVNGVIDDSFHRVAEGEPGYLALGGGTTLSGWPRTSSWDFVAVGRGHDTAYWTQFLRSLHKIDPDMPVNIEHEDRSSTSSRGCASPLPPCSRPRRESEAMARVVAQPCASASSARRASRRSASSSRPRSRAPPRGRCRP